MSSSTETLSLGKGHRFPTLDALRGVAALSIIAFHNPGMFGSFRFPRGYLAVDFFFMLSGFVLSRAYQSRLDRGWSTLSFMKVRAIRLYPLHALALMIGVLGFLVLLITGRASARPSAIIIGIVLNLMFLPAPYTASGGNCFPFNVPAWSLFFEIVMNLLHALCLRNRTTKWIMVALVCSFVPFAAAAFALETCNFGQSASAIFGLYGFARVICSYLIGMLLFRSWSSGKRRVRLPLLVLPLLLAAPMMVSTRYPLVAFELATIVLLFPVIIFAAAGTEPGPKTIGIATILGQASYAVYILQQPLVGFAQMIWNRLASQDMYHYAPWSGLLYASVVLALAVLLDRTYDFPVRARLSRVLRDAWSRPAH